MSAHPYGVAPSVVVNSSDHGALVRVAAGFCTACMSFFLATRIFIRWPWRTLLGSDDVVAIIASGLAVIQVAITMVAVSHGLGRKTDLLSENSLKAAEKLIYAADLLFLLIIFLGKSALALLFVRLASVRTQRMAAIAIASASIASGAVSILLIAVPQAGFSPWTYGLASSESMIARWAAVAVMSNLLEVALLAFPILLLWGLRMKRSTRALVVLGMWTRLPLIPISILRILSISSSLRSSSFTFYYATTEVLTQVEMAYTLIAATIPCLRIFLQSAKTGLLAGETGLNVVLGTTTDHSFGLPAVQTTSSMTSSKSRKRGRVSMKLCEMKVLESMDHTSLARGKSPAEVGSDDQASMASDFARKAVVVRESIDVQ